MKVTDHIEMIEGTMANSFLVQAEGGTIIVDAGTQRSGRRIVEFCRKRGLSPSMVLITHYHPDHIGGLYAVYEAFRPKIYAGSVEIPVIGGRSRMKPANSLISKVVASLIRSKPVTGISDAKTLNDSEIKVIDTPGHTPGSTSYLFTRDSAIFVGDALYEKHGQPQINRAFTLDYDRAKDSVREIMRSGAQLALPGHGKPLRLTSAATDQ
ncbi:MAG TPA: MBL fold metallo-hydrolase [Thermoplasmataceae archaeon]|nr:MBL fold metallo-hydrolase [Thermoplasmataceae archaeon]